MATTKPVHQGLSLSPSSLQHNLGVDIKPSGLIHGLSMKAGAQHLAAHVQLGLAPHKKMLPRRGQSGHVFCTHSDRPHNTAKFLFGQAKQAVVYFQGALKETRACDLSRSHMHSVYTEESAAQLSFCPAIRHPGSRACVEPSSLALTPWLHRVILSAFMCSTPSLSQSSNPLSIYHLHPHMSPGRTGTE